MQMTRNITNNSGHSGVQE